MSFVILKSGDIDREGAKCRWISHLLASKCSVRRVPQGLQYEAGLSFEFILHILTTANPLLYEAGVNERNNRCHDAPSSIPRIIAFKSPRPPSPHEWSLQIPSSFIEVPLHDLPLAVCGGDEKLVSVPFFRQLQLNMSMKSGKHLSKPDGCRNGPLRDFPRDVENPVGDPSADTLINCRSRGKEAVHIRSTYTQIERYVSNCCLAMTDTANLLFRDIQDTLAPLRQNRTIRICGIHPERLSVRFMSTGCPIGVPDHRC